MAIELEDAVFLKEEVNKNTLLSKSLVSKKKTFYRRLCLKCKILYENLKENVTYRFYGFLIL
jgi:hypothetical protein